MRFMFLTRPPSMPRPKAPEIPCGNPLFLSWVGEWMDNARTLNSKGYQAWKKVLYGKKFSLTKAYESIKQCPIAYDHPSELIRLNGIGMSPNT
jgi:crossover junction endonuclease MUS81